MHPATYGNLRLDAWHKETMTVFVRDHRGDGTSTIVDSADGTVFEIPTAEWPAIAALPNEAQRAALERVAGEQRQHSQEVP